MRRCGLPAGHHQTFVFVGQSRCHRNFMLHRAQHVRALLKSIDKTCAQLNKTKSSGKETFFRWCLTSISQSPPYSST